MVRKGKIDNRIRIEDYNTSLISREKSYRQKTNKETVVLTLDQLDLIYTCKTCHLKTAEYTFSSSTCGTFSRTDHMLGPKTSLNNFRGQKLYQTFFLTIIV